MGLEPGAAPDAMHGDMTDADQSGHPPCGPMRERRGRPLLRLRQDLGFDPRIEAIRASTARQVPQRDNAAVHHALLPAGNERVRHAEHGANRGESLPVGEGEDHARAAHEARGQRGGAQHPREDAAVVWRKLKIHGGHKHAHRSCKINALTTWLTVH